MKDMEFGMRLVKTHRTAFNRQISEPMEIQNPDMEKVSSSLSPLAEKSRKKA